MRILLLEDDTGLRSSFARRLRSDGHDVDEVGLVGAARTAVADADYDCLVLDRMVTDGDSLDWVAELDRLGAHPPVIIVSALGDADHRTAGINTGADDYIAKPVRLDELSLRVAGVADRVARTPAGNVVEELRLGAVTVDPALRRVTIADREVTLSPIQYRVLVHLFRHVDRPVPVEELIDRCWDDAAAADPAAVRPVISRLRRTFAGVLDIRAERGAGYRLSVPPSHPPPRSR